ncbi:hypothetical protein ACFYY8_33780 [Streptosporangium sp. NPDC001559]|uniref:hypothetical protein n=1 Tax=Streptosporangium sp. NPDC001559 TaxID=3366187 RepID=UPI0036E9A157
MASTELVRRTVIRFGPWENRVEVTLPYPLPKSTLDPRYAACIDHRTACDCREAAHAEGLAEWRAERARAQRVFNDVLRGHQTFAWTPEGDRDVVAECKCSGCEIARCLDYRGNWDVSRDREAAGLNP